ncbi:MAG TPA: hypothetical protein VLA31_02880 [Burkholderiaceae bacterium]|jgi:hypothetical protein|nr:hypothetical protein [Burkholderiaceae bacterium]
MFFKRKPEAMPVRDVQSEAVAAIIQGASVLPSKRLTGAIFTALLDNRGISVEELDDLANRISRLAWNRGRR